VTDAARDRRADLFAGLTVALVLIPQSLAYAELAGLPPHHGLYTATIPLILAALFASSPYLQTGPTALTSLLVFGAIAPRAAPGSGEFVGLAAVLAVLVGAMRIALGLARAGRILGALTPPVTRGFTTGAAVLILASQLPSALGVDVVGVGILDRAWAALADPTAWVPAAALLATVTLALMFGGPKLHSAFPGVLVAAAVGIVWSVFGEWPAATLGEIPAGLPRFDVSLPWGDVPDLLLPSAIIAVVGFAEPASIAKIYAEEDGAPWDPHAEFVSQGLASLSAGFIGGFPVGGSFSRSALNRISGARTRRAGAVTGLAVLLFLPFSDLVEPLPRCVLAAIVMGAAASLLKPAPIRATLRSGRRPALIALGTFVATLASAPRIELGVVTGIVLAGASAAYDRWNE